MTEHQPTPADVAATLERSPLGGFLGAEGCAVLASYAEGERRLSPDDYLFMRGDAPEAFFLLTAGQLAVEREPGRVVHVLEPGDLVGELSFIDGVPHTQSVRALEDATLLTFVVGDVTPLLEQHPRVMFDFMRAVIARVHQTAASLGRERQELSDFITRGGRRS